MIYKKRPADFNPSVEVTSCFVTCGNKYLILKAGAHKKYEPNKWGSPAGKMDPGEDRTAATLREVEEETGLQLRPENLKFFDTVYVRYPGYDFIYHMYSANFTQLPQVIITDEHQEFSWKTIDEALALDLIKDEDAVLKLFEEYKTR